MKKQLTTQLEKFNTTAKKAAALQAEKKQIDAKKQQEKFEQAMRYNMVKTEELFEGHATNVALSVIDIFGEAGAKQLHDKGILEEEAAIVMSQTGVHTFFQTLEAFGDRLIEKATAPLKAEVNELRALLIEQQKQERITQMLVEQLLSEKEFPASRQDKMFQLMEDYKNTPQSELIDLNPQPRNKNKKKIDLPKLVEIEVTKDVEVVAALPSWEIKWKRGKKPATIVTALTHINHYMKLNRIDWPSEALELKALIKDFLIIAEYEGLDINNTLHMQQSKKYKRVYLKAYREFGSYKNFVKELF